MSFQEQLKQARKKLGYTQQIVSDKIGVTKSTYCGYETGKRQPDVQKIKDLAHTLRTSADVLIEVIAWDGDNALDDKKSPAAVQEDKGKAELDDIYYSLNEAGQEQIIDHARYVASKAEFKKCDKLSMAKEEA